MYSYITSELPKALFASFSELDSERVSITGHSMGGHGALTLFLKNPGMYKSVSAFAPITNPSSCPWGEKAFKGYFGEDKEAWKEWDATELVRKWEGPLDVLIDVVWSPSRYEAKQIGLLIVDRGREITSTSKSSYFQKISPRRRRRQERMADWLSDTKM